MNQIDESIVENPFSVVGLLAKTTRAFGRQGGTPELLNQLAEDTTLVRKLVLLLQNARDRSRSYRLTRATGTDPEAARDMIPVLAEIKLGKLLKLEERDIVVSAMPAPVQAA